MPTEYVVSGRRPVSSMTWTWPAGSGIADVAIGIAEPKFASLIGPSTRARTS